MTIHFVAGQWSKCNVYIDVLNAMCKLIFVSD